MQIEQGEPHPLCTCPPLTWSAVTGRAPSPDWNECRSRAFGGIDTHPVIDPRDIARTGR